MDRQYFRQNISNPQTFHGTVSHVFDVLENTVGATYGPGGTHNIFMMGPGELSSSKDGLENLTMMKMDSTIARTVHQMAIEVAQRQASIVGDGTTSAVLIMAQVYKQLRTSKALWNKYTSSTIHNAMNQIQDGIISMLKNAASKINTDEEAFHLAYTSTDRNRDLADVIAKVYKITENFADTNIILDYSATEQTYHSNSKGLSIMGRMMNQAFNNYDIETCKLKEVEVVVVDGAATITNDILEYANQLKLSGKSLLIICSGIKNENFYRYIEAVAQKQPAFLHNMAVVYSDANTLQKKDTYYDLIKSSGCAILEEGVELNSETIREISKGYAQNVLIKDKKMTLAGFNQTPELETWIESIAAQIAEIHTMNDNPEVSKEDVLQSQMKINSLKARHAKLKDGTTTIYVGGETSQRKSINYRLVEDGVKALQAALNTGYFVGCNTTTMNVIYQLLIKQKQSKGNLDDVYGQLLTIILTAYINVYKKLVTNRVATATEEAFYQMIINEKCADIIKPMVDDVSGIEVDVKYAGTPVFCVVNLADGDELASVVINPASTDTLIVEKAIDAALILATANTIMTDEHNEFESVL
jgi:chaperonin GroEL (HSP60 family)